MITEKLMSYVEDKCLQPANLLTKAFYKEHILVVYDYCSILGSVLKCDSETVCIAALLHDISAVLDIRTLPKHNLESAAIAESVLRSYKFPEDRIKRVKGCIINHMSPLKIDEGPLEDVVLSNADAVSQIIVPSYWLYYAFRIKNLCYDDGIKWYAERIENNWNSLIDPAKNIIEDKYLNVKTALNF